MTHILEKRKNFRHKVNGSLIYWINLSGTHRRAEKLDHNESGLSFVRDLDLKPGTVVYVRCERCSPNCPGGRACESCRLAALATVKWGQHLEDDGMESYLTGAKCLEHGFG